MRADTWYSGQGNAGLVAGGMAMLIHSDPRGELVSALWPAVGGGELSAILAQLATQGLERLPDFALAVGRGNGLLILSRGTMSAHVFRGNQLIDEVRADAVTTWRETAFEDVDRVVLAAGAAAHLAGVGLPILGGIVSASRVEMILSPQSGTPSSAAGDVGSAHGRAGSRGGAQAGGPDSAVGRGAASSGGASAVGRGGALSGGAASAVGVGGASAVGGGAGEGAVGGRAAPITREWMEPQAKPREPEPLRPITALFSDEPLPTPAPLPNIAAGSPGDAQAGGAVAAGGRMPLGGGTALGGGAVAPGGGVALGGGVATESGVATGGGVAEGGGAADARVGGLAEGAGDESAGQHSGAAAEERIEQRGALLDRLSWVDSEPQAEVSGPRAGGGSSHFGDTVSRSRASEASVAAVRCPKLHLNPPATPACRECLLPLDPTQEPFFVAQPIVGRLRRLDNEQEWPLSKRVTVLGRSPASAGLTASADLQLVAVTEVSKAVCDVHAEVRLRGWRLEVVDRSDRGGTMVTNPGDRPVRLEPGVPMRLLLGGQVRLADEVSFVFGL